MGGFFYPDFSLSGILFERDLLVVKLLLIREYRKITIGKAQYQTGVTDDA
jgi:hypothetical protein